MGICFPYTTSFIAVKIVLQASKKLLLGEFELFMYLLSNIINSVKNVTKKIQIRLC